MSKAKKLRAKRKVIGHRDASSGEFVSQDFADEHPETTVAVTREERDSAHALMDYVDALEREAKGDEEC